MIAGELEENIQFTFRDARERGLEFVTTEHLLLVLLDSSDVGIMLDSLKADRVGLRNDLEDFLAKRVPKASQPGAESRPTPGFQRVIRRAAAEAKNLNCDVTGLCVIASIYNEPESFGAQYLVRRGINRKRIGVWLRTRALNATATTQTQIGEGAETTAAAGLTRNLTAAVMRNEIEKPRPRQDIEQALARVLCRKYKSNPILVGDPGVGKTAIVHALAHQVAVGEVPEALADLQIHEIQVSSLVAGTRYRGDFEARMKQLVGEISRHPNSLLFVDEIHSLIGAGSVSGGNLDAASILKPALVNGTLRCIGATTPAEYARIFAKDSALARRFQKIQVPEPSDEEALAILRELQPRLEKHHGIRYREDALDSAVRMSRRYLSNRSLPDKAIDLLDDIGAARSLAGASAPVTSKIVAGAIAQMSGLPASAVAVDDRSALRRLERSLAERVYGQPEAVAALAKAVKRARLGFATPGRPIGSFLFTGPTGVGKTALAAALAEALGLQLLRFDMSEYMEKHSLSRLIGAPPGYVGFEQAGQLTEKVSGNPHCVLLLDEIEKAHPDIFSILLQVMDYGTLTDNAGQAVDFRHALVVMTSNAGASDRDRAPLGFVKQAAGDSSEQQDLKRLFSPEFRNRLDAQISFASLAPDVAGRIVAKELAGLGSRLEAERGLKVSFAKDVIELLLEVGFSESMGARPLQRTINSLIVDAIVEADLGRRARPGTRMVVSAPGGQVKIERMATS
ncbi:MAG: AAA family ATPase [Betaproteobacteria bacterium]|nr:AAA family ATPase [Betaproteobacteria bacterium]